ncbi:MAG: CDP-glycerol glycerophosphotransferase family protein [Clostridia bacterium]|nr:CDP-glycerol glycerophosphotransferase family protein [Clostridia bacterium]
MKKLFYSLYALFFNISRIFPLRKNRVAFVAPHNGGDNDSLSVMRRYFEDKGGYDVVSISTQDLKLDFSSIGSIIKSCLKAAGFFTFRAYLLATSKYVFLNDNFMPMSLLKFSNDAVITQLWHAEGAFKKFGLSAPVTDDVREREKKCSAKLTYVICSSESVVLFYAEAFGVETDKILPLGSARIDSLLAPTDTDSIRRSFDESHPECKGKELVLYAPTFRDSAEKDAALVEKINIDAFNREFPDKRLLVKLHPQIHSATVPDGATNVTDCDIGMLTLICNCVITDYSSVCMDFALLSKPCIFFAFDLDEYEHERSFYFDYESGVPGPVVRDSVALLEAIKNPRKNEEKLRQFREFHFDFIDCNNAERIYNSVTSANS